MYKSLAGTHPTPSRIEFCFGIKAISVPGSHESVFLNYFESGKLFCVESVFMKKQSVRCLYAFKPGIRISTEISVQLGNL